MSDLETAFFTPEDARTVERLRRIQESLGPDSLARHRLGEVISDIEASARKRACRHQHLLDYLAGQAPTIRFHQED